MFLTGKIHGFRYLFSDREVRLVSIFSFLVLVALVSTQYLAGIVPDRVITWIGIGALVLFTYILVIFISFNILLVFGKFRDNRRYAENKTLLRGMKVVAVVFTLVSSTILVGPWLFVSFFFVAFSFISWIAISTLFFCRFVADIARVSRVAILRAIIFVVIVVLYVVYMLFLLWFKLRGASSGGSISPVIDENIFDWALALFLLFYGYASMGQRFLPAGGIDTLDFYHLSWRQEVRLRESVLFILLVSIGYELLLRGLSLIFARADLLPWADVLVTVLRLAFLVPGAIVFFFVALLKQKKGKT